MSAVVTSQESQSTQTGQDRKMTSVEVWSSCGALDSGRDLLADDDGASFELVGDNSELDEEVECMMSACGSPTPEGRLLEADGEEGEEDGGRPVTPDSASRRGLLPWLSELDDSTFGDLFIFIGVCFYLVAFGTAFSCHYLYISRGGEGVRSEGGPEGDWRETVQGGRSHLFQGMNDLNVKRSSHLYWRSLGLKTVGERESEELRKELRHQVGALRRLNDQLRSEHSRQVKQELELEKERGAHLENLVFYLERQVQTAVRETRLLHRKVRGKEQSVELLQEQVQHLKDEVEVLAADGEVRRNKEDGMKRDDCQKKDKVRVDRQSAVVEHVRKERETGHRRDEILACRNDLLDKQTALKNTLLAMKADREMRQKQQNNLRYQLRAAQAETSRIKGEMASLEKEMDELLALRNNP